MAIDGPQAFCRIGPAALPSVGKRPYRRRDVFLFVVVVVVIVTLTGTLRPVRVGTRTVRALVAVRRLVDMAYLPLPLEPLLPLAPSTTVVVG